MRKLFIIIIFFLTASFVFGEVQIDEKYIVPNRDPGYCCWACLETLGNFENISVLKNLVDNRSKDPDDVEAKWVQINGVWTEVQIAIPKNIGTRESVRKKLNSLHVKYKITLWDYEHLKESVEKNGCVVFMKPNSVMKGGHAVILTNFNDKNIDYIDPNDQQLWMATREWFDKYWHGIAISIEK